MDVTSRADEISARLANVVSRIIQTSHHVGRIAEEISLIVVTKTYPTSDIELLLELGVKNFGENRDAEGAKKSQVVPGTWHFQGQIQSNKIGSISRWADVVHSLDDARHAELLNKSMAFEKTMGVFIQVNLEKSAGRGGADPTKLGTLADGILKLPHLKLMGLMAVAPLAENPESAFTRLAVIHSDFCRQFPDSAALSAGMSNDFEIAIIHGATHLRIGSSILGSRLSPL